MKPYYDSGGIQIFHGDCREALPGLAAVDLVLTDPPYGIGRDGQKESTGGHGGRKAYDFMGWDRERPSAETFALVLNAGRAHVIWGGNYFADLLPARGGWLVWDKAQRINQSDGELAWTSENRALRIYDLNRVALMTDGAEHPTQKPVGLMRWCLGLFPGAASILDPFMGSGTTLRAAKDLGRRAIGIEIEERYCEIAARRLDQEVLPGMVAEPRHEQAALAAKENHGHDAGNIAGSDRPVQAGPRSPSANPGRDGEPMGSASAGPEPARTGRRARRRSGLGELSPRLDARRRADPRREDSHHPRRVRSRAPVALALASYLTAVRDSCRLFPYNRTARRGRPRNGEAKPDKRKDQPNGWGGPDPRLQN